MFKAKRVFLSVIKSIFLYPSFLLLGFNSFAQFSEEVPTDQESIQNGEEFFSQICSACHAINERVVGPALSGVYERREQEWILKFVKNSQQMVESGDETAQEIFNEYGIPMPAQDLSDEEIMDIMAYIKSEDTGGAAAAQQTGDEGDAGAEAAAGADLNQEMVAQGETLFKNNCAVCHNINEQLVGPPLKNIHERRPMDWIIRFVQNSQKVIQSGDEYAVQLYNEYNQTLMPSFDFSEDEIKSVVEYIKAESVKAAAPTAEADQEVAPGEEEVEEEGDVYLVAILVGLLIVLAIILGVLIVIASLLKKNLRRKPDLEEENREIVEQKFKLKPVFKSNIFLFFAVFILTAVIFKNVIDSLFAVGVQQGYQPTQPIAFSHKLHAGQYEIDCNYCHTGVRISKNANIPSANICMNCHVEIKQESPEIQKIYAALDYDPKSREYGNDQKPIEWIRIHNLPDLAYFNHSQHVKVGGIECQTCHGEIQEMEVVAQASPLTMGWCIECHRETQVKTRGNDYYNKLVEVHEQSSGEPMTVEDIGGLECAKCHY